MRKNITKLLIIGLAVFGMAAFLLPTSLLAGEVDVYLEGAYDDEFLDVYIYADCNVAAVISYGVRLEYLGSELTVDDMAKNDATKKYTSNTTVWALGDGTNKEG